MKFHRRLFTSAALAACAALLPHAGAFAQAYPSKPIRIIVPFAAGGGVDILTRVLAQHLGDALKQSVIVEDRAGAGGNLGVDAVAKSAPDGYTLVMATTGTHTINPELYRSLPFDPEKSFSPISLVASVPNLLVVNPSVPAKNVQELVALAKARPGTLSYASFGNGTSNHLSGEMFKAMAGGLDVAHVPYKSATQAVSDLVAGQTAFAFVNTPLALPFVRAGKLRALAVTGAKRSAATPEFPTMNTSLPGFAVESWYGLMAPAGTPQPVIARLTKEVHAVLAKPEVQAFFAKQGADVETSTPAEFATRVRQERAVWAKVIKSAGVQID